jgi:hypothetical protein
MTCCNLFVKILVISFSTKLRRDIGLKSPILLGLLILGTRVMRDLLIACRLPMPL